MMDFNTKLLVKFLLDELTEEELEQLLHWQALSEENTKIFSDLIHLKISNRFIDYNASDKIESALTNVNNQINRGSYHYWLPQLFKYVAIFILLIGLSYGGWYYFSNTESYVSIVVKEGEEIKKISLSDGTLVWLNNGSTLKIPESFSEQNRKIIVDGEVYFDVKKNQKNPFLVETEYMNVKVFGTSFNLNTHLPEGVVETVLASGKVAIQDKKENTLFELSPGERVLFTPGNNEYIVEKTDANISTAWHLDQLKFESVTLREIANKLSVIYDVNMNLESKKLAERRFRYVINKDESLLEALEILKYLARFDYRIEGDEVFINEQHKK